jgi:hypothetical protein
MSDKNSTTESKAAKERKHKALLEIRNKQLSDYWGAIEILKSRISGSLAAINECDALSSHTNGFYDEIDKLTKGKALIGVTDMTVTLANDIIRDAKKNIKNDARLDRIKEFVPAGDNPVYPDVLIVIRAVRQSLDRHRGQLKNHVDSIKAQIQTAHTVVGALRFVLNEDDDIDFEEKEYLSEEDIRPFVEGFISASCFTKYNNSQDRYFDFDRLDEESVEKYLSMTPESDKDQESDDGLTKTNAESEKDEEPT